MPQVAPIRLSLELDAWPEPIAGRLRDHTGHEEAFHGWLGLASALEVLTRSAQPAAPTHTTVQED